MASNKNNQQKGSGADNSDINKSTASDASDVDWMIMSDLSTRIGGSPQPQKTIIQSTAAKPATQNPTSANLDNDLEDLEWLQSIGLDAEIERSPSPSITVSSTETQNNVENIDWMIVTNLKQRMDDSEIKARAKANLDNIPPPTTVLQSSLDSLSDSLNNDLGLGELNFLEDSDLADLDDLGFDTSDTFDNLDSSSLDFISNDNEQNLLELNSFLEDNFDLSNDLSNDLSDELNDLGQNASNDWESIAGFESLDEDLVNQFEEVTTNVNEQIEEPIVDINQQFDQFEESINDVNPQIAQFEEDIVDLSEIYLEEQSVDQDEQLVDYSNLQTDTQSGLAIFNDSFEMETQISAIASVNPEYEPEFNSAIAEVSEEIYTTEELDEEYSEELDLEESAAVFADQIQTNQDIQDIFNNEEISRDAEEFNSLDDSFGEIQDINSLDAAAISDEVWSNSANISIDTDSYDDAFANSWEVDVQNIASSSENIDVSDDAIWGGDILESSSISDKAISNAFEPEEWSVPTSPDYAEPSGNEFVYEDLSEIATDQDWSADLEDEIDEISPEVPISETSWDIGNEDSYAQDLEQNFVQDFVQIVDASNELSAEQNSDWILESEQALTTDDLDAGDLSNWQDSIEAESAADYYADELDPNSYDLGWEQLPVADEDVNALEPLEILAENAAVDSFETDNFIGENNVGEENIDEDFDFQDSLDDANLDSQNDDDWAIAEASLDYASTDSSFVDNFVQDEFTDTYESLSEPLMEELEIPQSDLSLANNSVEDFDQDFAAAIADQITGSGFNNDLDSYTAYPLQSELNPIPAPNNYPENNLSSAQTDELESILDEDFDLATFDDDSLIDYSLSEDNNIATMLTPVRPNSANTQANVEPNAINDQQEPFPSALDLDDFGLEDEFERAIANDSLEDEFAAELGIEESLANEMLNGNGVSADFSPNLNLDVPSPSFDSGASVNSFPTPSVGSSYDSNDHDFLDDFDLDSIGTAFDSDEFDSNFINPVISTGLTPPAPPSQPTPVPSPALPTINNNPPPPPPFMLPLPPKRSTAQPKQSNPTSGRPLTTPNQTSGGAVSIDDRNFDSFHNDHHDSSKFKNNKSISSIDEGWSDLLDADTVLSDVLPSPMDSRTINPSQMANIPPRPMMNTGNPSQGRSPENSSTSARRKQPRLPDFDELGLEVHDDNNDWSGLLESGDLSDNITTISPSTTPLSSRGQQPIARRSDITSVSETREIPRDRRSPQVTNFGDATQARMAAHPDQIDFNRFTEDNYDRYEPPSNFPEAAPSKSQATKPSISLESLWQNYLKFPTMGLGAIGAALLLYTVMNRPVFELGLRWGIFKDARGLDFTNADFRGAKLDNVDFSKAILTKAKMQDASLEGANFQDANLDGVSFVKANLNQAKLVGTSVVWSEFRDAQMRFVDFSGADLTRSNFSGANLTGASFRGTKIGAQGTDKATKLPPINLLAWQIVNQPLEGRNLANKNLSGLNLSFSNLKRANLTKARLNFTDLAEADLRGANLTGGQLDGANLNGAKLNGINLTGVKFDKSKLPKTDAQTVCPDGKNGPCKF